MRLLLRHTRYDDLLSILFFVNSFSAVSSRAVRAFDTL